MNSESMMTSASSGLIATIRARLENRPDSEHVQALVRIAIACIVWLYIFYFSNNGEFSSNQQHVLFVITCAVLIAVGLFALIISWPQTSALRRFLGMTIDFSTLSYLMYVMEDKGILFFAIYLWVTIGNGLRYGARYLYTAMAMGIIGILIVFNNSAYWKAQWGFSMGLLIAQIALPLYFSILLKQLSCQHEELKKLYKQMARHATHDSLTSLPNRKHFHDRLAETIILARTQKSTFTVLYLDLDGFKVINDDMGHAIGDQLIEQTARRLEQCVRKEDMVARIGGDEFVVLLQDVASSGVSRLAEKIIETLSKPFLLNNKLLSITTSIGTATFPQDGADVNTLLHSADCAMYEAKRNGKNGYQIYRNKFTPIVPVSINGRVG